MRDFRVALKEYDDKKYPPNKDDFHILDIRPDPHRPKPLHGDCWGRWQYDKRNKTLDHTVMKDYWIGLDRLKDEEDLGHWLLHLQGKRWVTPLDLANLVYAIHDIMGVSA